MPFLQITTNTDIDDIDQVASDASGLVAQLLGKPESYVMVNINGSSSLTFAGTDEPCAHLKLKSLGLNEKETGSYSEKLCQFVSENLSISPSRVYIEFSSPERHMWGWDNRTF